eukprot:SAG11_NODE_2633_length_3151_cov_1.261468_2_plen_191_part_00
MIVPSCRSVFPSFADGHTLSGYSCVQVASADPPSMTISLSDVSPAGLTNSHYPNNYCLGTHNAITGECNDKNWTTSFSCDLYSRNANSTHGAMCAWAELSFNATTCPKCAKPDPKNGCPPCAPISVNATVSVLGPTTLMFTAPPTIFPVGTTGPRIPIGSSYGWGAVPMLTLYDKSTRLPVLAWQEPTAK